MKPKILLLCDPRENAEQLLARAADSHEVVIADNPMRALVRLTRDNFAGVYVSSEYLRDALELGRLLQNQQILERMPDGVVLLDTDNTIIWSNARLCEWCHREKVVGENFYTVLGGPEILGPDFCPFHTALATGQPTTSTLRSGEARYFHVHAAPVHEGDDLPRHLIVTVRDVTNEIHQQQKMAAIHQAGMDLADLSSDEIARMEVHHRIELVKSNILHFTRDLLHFDVVEIRLLDHKSGLLKPLLAMGMEPEAAARELSALPQNNGVTGFVAATGKSYLCEDTSEDPLYLPGAHGARSSLTVPLILRDEVIGTFNVESPRLRAFSESDLQFLEIFCRDVAASLNTLELLATEKACTMAEGVVEIHKAVARPIDEIINDASRMERLVADEPEAAELLRRVLTKACGIKEEILKIGRKMAPTEALPPTMQVEEQPLLRDRRILVVDAHEDVRNDAHNKLERYGCSVETVHDGATALNLVRALIGGQYDLIIAGVDLPDMNGYEFMLKLQEIIASPPFVLMQGNMYDPSHSVVNARRAGLPVQAVIHNSFRLEQLLAAVEVMAKGAHPEPQPQP